MSRNYYDDEDDLDIHVRHRGPSPGPVRYVQRPAARPQSYYDAAPGPSYLAPEHLVTVARSRSRDRSRSHDRRTSSPPPPAPVIINNRIYNEHSSDEDDDRRMQLVGSSRHRHRSRSWSRSRSQSSSHMTREDWEAEQARKDLEGLLLSNTREKDERRLLKEYQEEEELRRAKRELDDIKGREARTEEEKRLKKEMELKRLREEDEENEERDRREKEAKDAVEHYKQAERDRILKAKKQEEEKEKEAKEAVERYKQAERDRLLKEREEKEATDREYQRRLEEDLRRSGLDDKAIKAILKKEKVKKEAQEHVPTQVPISHVGHVGHTGQIDYAGQYGHSSQTSQYGHSSQTGQYGQSGHSSQTGQYGQSGHYGQMAPYVPPPQVVPVSQPGTVAIARPTYTRMARKHLSIETLRSYQVDFDFDSDPDYVLIKRWVPEWEQDQLWKHTKYLREKRGKMLLVEEKKHAHHEPEFEWVRKKHDRKRSKSPSLLMYLAGARPA
ncbi:hypothetical protein G7Z17_g10414 [Cylindrodendrum hubeiense]|uniref:DUF8035 domain-containing protein n=1 Tax=Cylindrodendrum hubeiense TaxID=595255 RepID=A0A9P5H4X0_9HYPO|nr:hypothetical protein G7Z17_g10414 [Cylindrodendrum hubeiense]